jgi:hypothetical protein
MSEQRKMVEAAVRGASKGLAKLAADLKGLTDEQLEQLMREDLQTQQDQIERRRQLGPVDDGDRGRELYRQIADEAEDER